MFAKPFANLFATCSGRTLLPLLHPQLRHLARYFHLLAFVNACRLSPRVAEHALPLVRLDARKVRFSCSAGPAGLGADQRGIASLDFHGTAFG
jgi:hypothetical protein